jgi:hypothetical protein
MAGFDLLIFLPCAFCFSFFLLFLVFPASSLYGQPGVPTVYQQFYAQSVRSFSQHIMGDPSSAANVKSLFRARL